MENSAFLEEYFLSYMTALLF